MLHALFQGANLLPDLLQFALLDLCQVAILGGG